MPVATSFQVRARMARWDQKLLQKRLKKQEKMKNKSAWVRLHLLNHNLHGPGNQKWNLTPGRSHPTNLEDMLKKVEAPAKEAVFGKGGYPRPQILKYETK